MRASKFLARILKAAANFLAEIRQIGFGWGKAKFPVSSEGDAANFQGEKQMDPIMALAVLANLAEIVGFLQNNKQAITVENITSVFRSRADVKGSPESKLNLSNEAIESAAVQALTIFDAAPLFLTRIGQRCFGPYKNKVEDTNVDETDLDEAHQVLKRCICKNIQLARDGNGGIFPSEELKELWKNYGC
jgi:isopropylmalate/homocitrate/citramalate synthase